MGICLYRRHACIFEWSLFDASVRQSVKRRHDFDSHSKVQWLQHDPWLCKGTAMYFIRELCMSLSCTFHISGSDSLLTELPLAHAGSNHPAAHAALLSKGWASAAARLGLCCIEGQQAHPGKHRMPCCDMDRQHRCCSSFTPSAAPCRRYASIILRLYCIWHLYMYTYTVHWSEADALALLSMWLPGHISCRTP